MWLLYESTNRAGRTFERWVWAGNVCKPVFYIYDFIFDEPYRDSEFMTAMVNQIPNLLPYTSNTYPNMVVYYFRPLPYEKTPTLVLKRD